MDETGQRRQRERGVTTLETVGLAVAVALLLGGVATSLAGDGAPLGSAVAARVEELVSTQATALPAKRARVVRERRWSGGDEPLRVPRDELRMDPVIDPHALWTREWHAQGSPAGFDSRADARACAMCTNLDWSHAIRSGAGIDPDGRDVGVEGTLRLAARIALASIDTSVRGQHTQGPLTLSAHGRGRATIGADAEGEARLRVAPHAQELQLHGSAAAGAVARAEARLGVDLLGVSIRQGARAEGWAGVGARGTIGVRREPDRISWRFGWGAAVGLGGAAEWSGSVDVSKVPRRHRTVARIGLSTAMRMSPVPIPLYP